MWRTRSQGWMGKPRGLGELRSGWHWRLPCLGLALSVQGEIEAGSIHVSRGLAGLILQGRRVPAKGGRVRVCVCMSILGLEGTCISLDLARWVPLCPYNAHSTTQACDMQLWRGGARAWGVRVASA